MSDSANPPRWWQRWGWILGAGAILLASFCGYGDLRWQTKAAAQENADKIRVEAKTIGDKAADTAAQTQRDVQALSLRVVKLEEGQRWTLILLQQMADQQPGGRSAPRVPDYLIAPPATAGGK